MYHSINIGEKNTFDDWHLIYPGRPSVNPPQPKLNYVDVLGKSGSLDYTEALTKTPRYSDREGTWEFVILNPGDVEQYVLDSDHPITNSWDLYSEIMTYCNGKYFEKIWLEDDPDYYYSGRVWISGMQTGSSWSRITLSYHLEPFKYRMTGTSLFSFTINEEEIFTKDGKLVEFNLIPGAAPTPLYLRFTTTADYSALHFRFRNPELTTMQYWYSVSSGLDLSQGNYNKVLTYPTILLSNMSGDNIPDIFFGPPDDIDPDYHDAGPVTIEYWWKEARL